MIFDHFDLQFDYENQDTDVNSWDRIQNAMAPLFNNDSDDEKKDDGPPSALKLSGIVKPISEGN